MNELFEDILRQTAEEMTDEESKKKSINLSGLIGKLIDTLKKVSDIAGTTKLAKDLLYIIGQSDNATDLQSRIANTVAKYLHFLKCCGNSKKVMELKMVLIDTDNNNIIGTIIGTIACLIGNAIGLLHSIANVVLSILSKIVCCAKITFHTIAEEIKVIVKAIIKTIKKQ